MKYVFGPVPSRRLGQSLGIDTIPLKTCNWNCVYCQLGRSKPLVNELKEYIPSAVIIEQVEKALQAHSPGQIDWVTFVGSGEPTLHNGIGALIREVKKLTDLPVAVITNGALLFADPVRSALLEADAVLPSLDAGSLELYKKINRPHPGVPFEKYIQGLISFGQMYRGRLWLEVMLMHDLNDSEAALKDMAAIIAEIAPDEVHINFPTRPPVEQWVKPADETGLMRAIAILGHVAQVVHPQEGLFDLSGSDSAVDAIMAIITRHPMNDEQLQRTLAAYPQEQRGQILEELLSSGKAQCVERFGQRFWCGKPSFFPDLD